MAKRKPKDEASMAMEKCTLRLPRAIWREARIRALDEDRDFQALVADALRLYLKTPLQRTKEGQ